MTCSMRMHPLPPFRSSWDIAGSNQHRRMSWPMTNKFVQIIMLPAQSWKGGHIPQGDHMPPHKATTTRERYNQALSYARDGRLPRDAPRPLPTKHWPKENIELLERFHQWLLEGGTCEYSTNVIYLPMAGHVLGLQLKPHPELDLEKDLDCALEFLQAKGVGEFWFKVSRNGL